MEKLLLFQIGHVPNDDCRSERIDNCVRLVVNDESVVDLTAEADDRVQSKWLRHLFSGPSFSPKVATSETPFRKRTGSSSLRLRGNASRETSCLGSTGASSADSSGFSPLLAVLRALECKPVQRGAPSKLSVSIDEVGRPGTLVLPFPNFFRSTFLRGGPVERAIY